MLGAKSWHTLGLKSETSSCMVPSVRTPSTIISKTNTCTVYGKQLKTPDFKHDFDFWQM